MSCRHQASFRVYVEDTDLGGVVYHGRYLGFCERARTEALRDMGVPYQAMTAEHGRGFMVRRANLEYLRPARLDDVLDIVTTVLALTGATVTLRQLIEVGGRTIATAEVLLVCVNEATMRVARIPARWHAAFLAVAE